MLPEHEARVWQKLHETAAAAHCRWLRLHDGALAQREQLASIAANDAVISFLRKSLVGILL